MKNYDNELIDMINKIKNAKKCSTEDAVALIVKYNGTSTLSKMCGVLLAQYEYKNYLTNLYKNESYIK